jgi:transposase
VYNDAFTKESIMARPIKGTTFWDRVNTQLQYLENGCIVFTGHKNGDGYGRITKDGKLVYVHREVWKKHNPDKEITGVIMHSCDNPACVNPDHLSHGTQADNVADMVAKGRRVVVQGSKQSDAKLNESQIPEIRKLILSGMAYEKIGDMFGVTHAAIRAIAVGRTWTHVPMEDGSSGKNFVLRTKPRIFATDVPKIRKMLAENISCAAISRIFNVSEDAIFDIKHNRSWSNVS